MAPRSTALAGAQLAARQLNCESVFRGVLSYGRERNNAPAASVTPRRSAQPGNSALSLSPPRLRECGHRGLARRLVAVRWRAVLMMSKGECNFLLASMGFGE